MRQTGLMQDELVEGILCLPATGRLLRLSAKAIPTSQQGPNLQNTDASVSMCDRT